MNCSWQKFLSGVVLGSLLGMEILLPTITFAQNLNAPSFQLPNTPEFYKPEIPELLNIEPLKLEKGDEYNPASIKADCSTKGLLNYGVAFLFKSVNTLGGAAEGSALGTKPPNPFPEVNYDVTLDVGSCVKSLLETGARYAFAKFKKRLLDRLTDDTIAWINGETDGRPKFFTQPFYKVLQEAADAAAGDALMDLGLGEICSPFRTQINIELSARRPVQEAVRCTISQVIDNFEEFGKDFSKGNWLAYSESLKPQNNPWGATLIAKDAAQRAYQKRAANEQLEIAVSRGYKSEKKCTVWSFYVEFGPGEWKIVSSIIPRDISKHPDPKEKIVVSEAEKTFARNEFPEKTIRNYSWRCDQQITTAPADLYADVNSTAFTKDYDFVVNTDDLTPYFNAIFDAATNRLIKKSSDGLMAWAFNKDGDASIRSDNSVGRASTPLNPSDPNDAKFIKEEKNINPRAALANSLAVLVASSTNSLAKTSSTLTIVLASSTQFKGYLDELVLCETKTPERSCANTKTAQTEATDRYNSIKNTRISLNNAKENIDLFSKLDKNYSEPILSAAVDTMSGIYKALEQINSALIAEKKNIEDKMKITDVKNQLMLCQAPSQPYTCKP